jgi:hypothetical protein
MVWSTSSNNLRRERSLETEEEEDEDECENEEEEGWRYGSSEVHLEEEESLWLSTFELALFRRVEDEDIRVVEISCE